MSPIFDCGTSLWYNDLNVGSTDKSSTFKPTHAQQIKLVSDFSWLDFSALSGLNADICSIFLPSDRVDETRAEAIANVVVARCEELKSNKHFISVNKTTSKNGIVLAIIKGESTGIRVFYPDSKTTEDIIPMPDKADYLNTSISNKTLNPKFCSIENFPTLVASPDGSIIWQSGGAWILDELPDGRFTLVSPTGTVKTVSAEVAISYHKQHPFANGFVENGTLKRCSQQEKKLNILP